MNYVEYLKNAERLYELRRRKFDEFLNKLDALTSAGGELAKHGITKIEAGDGGAFSFLGQQFHVGFRARPHLERAELIIQHVHQHSDGLQEVQALNELYFDEFGNYYNDSEEGVARSDIQSDSKLEISLNSVFEIITQTLATAIEEGVLPV